MTGLCEAEKGGVNSSSNFGCKKKESVAGAVGEKRR